MRTHFYHPWNSIAAALLCSMLVVTTSNNTRAAEREGDWIVERDSYSGDRIHIMELSLTPQGEPTPALKYRLIPSEFERVDGNAAVYYLKALGFLEQINRQEQLRRFIREEQERAREEGKQSQDVPPYVWLTVAPHELPKEEVKQYLSWLAFQEPMLAEAARRRTFDMDRRIREDENPIMYLLPEIQSMREIARNQSIRSRLAIAENRTEEAIAIIGQQYALAAHLGQDQFLVSNLVGLAIAGIAFPDMLHLLQQSETPNLYWALAALPDPLVDMKRAYAFEREFLFEQVKALREVPETPQPAGYWESFVDRLLPQAEALGIEGIKLPFVSRDASPELGRAGLVAAMAAAYPGAKQFLIDRGDIDRETIESYSTAQTVLLAVRSFHEQAADDFFKWNELPYWQAEQGELRQQSASALERNAARVGWAAAPSRLFLPALQAASSAQHRADQLIALLQTVEAIRHYGATHDGKLPSTLQALELPSPMNPMTGKPLEYEFHGDRAVLSSKGLTGIQYRLVLRFAKNDPR